MNLIKMERYKGVGHHKKIKSRKEKIREILLWLRQKSIEFGTYLISIYMLEFVFNFSLFINITVFLIILKYFNKNECIR